MSGRTAAAFILLFIVPVLQAQVRWSVTYTNTHICAVRGSTVTISCTFTHPPTHYSPYSHYRSNLRVTSKFWFREKFKDLKSVPEYSGRVESNCDNNNKCTLTIRDLTESDSAVYKFRITSNIETEKWVGEPGVTLTVTDLQLIRSSQYLNCDSCSQTHQPSCIWSKNGEKILENFYYSAPTYINPPDDHTCTLGGHEDPDVPGEAVTDSSTNICAFKGSTVNISCKYSIWGFYWESFWTRKGSDVDLSSNSLQSYKCTQETINERSTNTNNYYNYRNTLTITNVGESDSAVYKFRIRSSGGVEKSNCKDGVRLTVPVSEPELQIHVRRQTVDQSRNQTELTCVSQCGDSLRSSYIWYNNNETLEDQTGSKVVLQSVNAAGRLSCALSGHQTFRSPAVYAPEGPSVSVRPSAEVKEGTSVTLSCSSDANPAADYSWFKDGEKSPNSSEQNFTITHVKAEDSGNYSCRVSNLMGHNQSTVEVTVVKDSSIIDLLQEPTFIGSAVGIFLIGLIGLFVVWFVKKNAREKPLVMTATRKEDASSQLEEDNLQYASILFSKEPTGPCSNVNASGPQDQDHVGEGGDVEYSNISFDRARATGAVGTEDSPDVIYSSVKK